MKWRYEVVEVENTDACKVSDVLIDETPSEPEDREVRQWDIFNMDRMEHVAYIVGEAVGPYEPPPATRGDR